MRADPRAERVRARSIVQLQCNELVIRENETALERHERVSRPGVITGRDPPSRRCAARGALAVPPGGSVVYTGGRFTAAGRAGRANLAAIDRASGSATAWNAGTDGPVRALSAQGGSLVVGGEFRKRDGRLVGADPFAARVRAEACRDRLVAIAEG